jgi:hypothetical protein
MITKFPQRRFWVVSTPWFNSHSLALAMRRLLRLVFLLLLLCGAALLLPAPTSGQEVRIRDLMLGDGTIPCVSSVIVR